MQTITNNPLTYKNLVKVTSKTVFAIGCCGVIIASTTLLTYGVKHYTIPLFFGEKEIVVQERKLSEMPKPLPNGAATSDKFGSYSGECFKYVAEAAQQLPKTRAGDPSRENILAALIAQESSGKPDKVSPTGARGCGQIVLKWHPTMRDKAFDARENVLYSAKFLAELIKKHGSYWSALPHYNGCVPANMCYEYRDKILRLAKNGGKS